MIKQDQVARIVGRADTEPFDIKDIYSSKNIRVGINSSVSRFQQSAPDRSFQK